MAVTNTLTIVGNLTADPEIRTVTGNRQVVSFTVACTPRSFNRTTEKWEDGEALFQRCSAWDEFAQNLAGSLTKGMRVFVTGVLKSRTYENKEGVKVTSLELQVDEAGPSLRYAVASVRKSDGKGPSQPAATADTWVGPGDDTPF